MNSVAARARTASFFQIKGSRSSIVMTVALSRSRYEYVGAEGMMSKAKWESKRELDESPTRTHTGDINLTTVKRGYIVTHD